MLENFIILRPQILFFQIDIGVKALRKHRLEQLSLSGAGGEGDHTLSEETLDPYTRVGIRNSFTGSIILVNRAIASLLLQNKNLFPIQRPFGETKPVQLNGGTEYGGYPGSYWHAVEVVLRHTAEEAIAKTNNESFPPHRPQVAFQQTALLK